MSSSSVVVTGGTGSLGTALANYYLLNPVDRYAILSRDSHKQQKLRKDLGDPDNFRWLLGDVRDSERLEEVFQNVDLVIHAAAIKDITAVEYSPVEGDKTNNRGTQNVIRVAKKCGVSKVMVISTDKAAAPINAYGVSKAMAEKIAVEANVGHQHTKTKVSCARYGNVIGSSGSVVPIWKKQSEDGTLLITDKKMSRFWIEMSDAVAFILGCIERMNGGEIFIPKLKSARLLDVAEAIAPGCHLAEIGVRPGEKIHETLITESEATHTKEFDDHFIIEPEFSFWTTDDIGGKPLPEGFSYSSDNNQEWLTVDMIRNMI